MPQKFTILPTCDLAMISTVLRKVVEVEKGRTGGTE